MTDTGSGLFIEKLDSAPRSYSPGVSVRHKEHPVVPETDYLGHYPAAIIVVDHTEAPDPHATALAFGNQSDHLDNFAFQIDAPTRVDRLNIRIPIYV